MLYQNKRWFLAVLIFFWLVLLTFSVIFFRERLLADSGYYLIRMINSGRPWVEHQRYILILSQVLPWIGVVLGAPLTTILLLYSLNHVVFHFLIFYLTAIRLKNLNAGLILVLLQIAGIAEGFFVPMFELYYAASLLILFYVLLDQPARATYSLLLAITAFFILSSHPVGMVLLIMVLIFHYLNTRIARWYLYIFIFILLIGFIAVKSFMASDYETGKAASIISLWQQGHFNSGWLLANLIYLLKHYFVLMICFAALASILLADKKLPAFTAYLIFIGLLVLSSSLNTDQYEPSRYNEQVWFPLSVIIFLPLLTADFSRKKTGTVLISLLLLFAVIRLGLIVKTGIGYAQRTGNLHELIAAARQQSGQYFIADDKTTEKAGIPGPNWSYPIESILFSSESGPENTVTICTTEDYSLNNINELLDGTNYLFWRLGPEPLSSLNSKYFRLRPGKYQVLKPEK